MWVSGLRRSVGVGIGLVSLVGRMRRARLEKAVPRSRARTTFCSRCLDVNFCEG